MYAAYFGLKQEPFSIAPDPRLLFMSEQHREALAHLLYGVQGGGGFVLLTGEIGTGKTTVCRSFLEQVPPHCNLAYIFNPKLTVLELLETVNHEFGVAVDLPAQRPATVKDHLDPLNAFLLQSHAAGRNNVLVIDEAQNLSADVLEQLRLLTNLETSERKLLQIILIGQPELREMLARPELEQLAQRVIARYHLGPLSETESADYVRHRLEASGLQQPLPFDARALRRVHQAAAGVPRRINLLCDRALLGAYAGGQAQVTRSIVDRAAAEVFPKVPPARTSRAWPRTAAAGVAGLVAGAGLLAAMDPWRGPPQPQWMSLALAPRLAQPVAVSLPPPTPAAPAKPTLLTDEDAAWRELAQAWKLTPPQGEPCTALAREQVMCFSRNMSLALIRELGRPGIVKLDAQTARPSYAVLAALTADTATLRAAGTEQTVTLAALAQRWEGDFATLWRAPAGYREGAVPTGWVAGRLAAVKGSPPPAGRAAADAMLRAELRAFQLAQGLPADGVPGPLTYMQLNRATGLDEPRLRTQP
jgi:general secretion pathway protein A